MPGIGTQSAGSSSAGYGTTDPVATNGGGFLRDPTTGKTLGARRINPQTRDFVMDEHGRILGVDSLRHMVQMSIHTEKGSAADTRCGQRLRSLDRITPNFDKRVLAILTEALQPLVVRGMIEIVDFVSYKAGNDSNGLPRGAVYGRLQWRDLTTKQVFKEDV
jgi:hypothetical protein